MKIHASGEKIPAGLTTSPKPRLNTGIQTPDHNARLEIIRMKKVKIGLWLLVLAFFGLLYFQNQELFHQKNPYNLNLYFLKYENQELYNGIALAVCFLAGVVIALLYALPGIMRARKTIKLLNKELEDQRSQIAALSTELNAFKSTSPPPAENPAAGEYESDETEATKVLS